MLSIAKRCVLISSLVVYAGSVGAIEASNGIGYGAPADLIVKGRYLVTFEYPGAGEQPIVQPPEPNRRGLAPFGEHSTDQSKEEIAASIGLRGSVLSIYDGLNAIYIEASEEEAARLSRDPRVMFVEPDMVTQTQGVQILPGWGLDRLDESGPTTDGAYKYSATGVGRSIYILDTGLTIAAPGIVSEFGSRASIVYDVNGLDGADCQGHGTAVASVAGGLTHGVAKEVSLAIAKITNGCTTEAYVSTSVTVLNWLAVNESPGTIINWSNALVATMCTPVNNSTLDNAFTATYNAGMLNVVSAGNDGCNTIDYSPTAIPESFVVGAVSLPMSTYDPKWASSRTGTNISTFAPGVHVSALSMDGTSTVFGTGTSFSAPYVAGIMALACEATGTTCNTSSTGTLYTSFRSTGTLGTVAEPGGAPLVGATSRFISQQW